MSLPAEAALLPPLYAEWMGQVLSGPIPAESKATCHDCAMCAPAGGTPAATLLFDPATKCCTYLPKLWNFLVGRILDDRSPEAAVGRASVERRIDAGIAVTPLGLEQTPVFGVLYQHVPGSFGRTRSLRCPHYLEESGGCGVWRHRESTCATWFCKHERGEVGKDFWSALHALLVSVEIELARWCAVELDLGSEALGQLFPPRARPAPPLSTPEDFDGRKDLAVQRLRWGRWAGREREFYFAAARLVAPLDWAAIEGIGGTEIKARVALVRTAHARLISKSVPDGLKRAPIQLEFHGRLASRVQTYSEIDPLDLPNELIGVLSCFDGRPTAEVLAEIAGETGLELTPGLVRRLADFGILRPAPGEVE